MNAWLLLLVILLIVQFIITCVVVRYDMIYVMYAVTNSKLELLRTNGLLQKSSATSREKHAQGDFDLITRVMHPPPLILRARPKMVQNKGKMQNHTVPSRSCYCLKSKTSCAGMTFLRERHIWM